jgi:hypothetical protein
VRVSKIVLTVIASVALFVIAVACGGSDAAVPSGGNEPTANGPVSSGLVAPDTFLTFDGQRYQLQDTLQADLVAGEFVEVGVASEADIDYKGELGVYRRASDDSSVYTLSPALDEEGVEQDTPALWLKWEPAE